MFRYAQVNEEGIVVSDSQLSGEIVSDHMIRLEDTFDLVNKKYNFELKQFEDYTLPQFLPVPSQLDRIEEKLALSIEEQKVLALDAFTLELIEGGLL